MDKDTITEGLNLAWNGQEYGQKLLDEATTQRDFDLGSACKAAFRFLYYIFMDERRKEKKERLAKLELEVSDEIRGS